MSDYKDHLHLVPEHMHSGITLWIEQGIQPGDFLTAVLSSNLMEAFGRADVINAAAMKDWCLFLYNYAPSLCHGSPEKVRAWAKRGGLLGAS